MGETSGAVAASRARSGARRGNRRCSRRLRVAAWSRGSGGCMRARCSVRLPSRSSACSDVRPGETVCDLMCDGGDPRSGTWRGRRRRGARRAGRHRRRICSARCSTMSSQSGGGVSTRARERAVLPAARRVVRPGRIAVHVRILGWRCARSMWRGARMRPRGAPRCSPGMPARAAARVGARRCVARRSGDDLAVPHALSRASRSAARRRLGARASA